MAIQSLKYVINRFLLRRDTLTAPTPEYGLRLRVKTEDVVGRHLYKYGVHEPDASNYLLANLALQPGDVVFDIGGNIGWFSLLLSKIANETPVDIFSFEPDPTNFGLLKENISLNNATSITPIQAAVAQESGTMTLHLFGKSNRGRHSLLAIHEGDTIDIRTTTLDEFWQERKLGERVPRFIKMDIEGFELMALKGASAVLARCPMVMLEFSPTYMRAAALDPAELIDLMSGHGFRPNELRDGRLHPLEAGQLKTTEQHIDIFWLRD